MLVLTALIFGVCCATAAAAEFPVTLSGRVGSLQEGRSQTAQIERLYGKPELSPAVGRGTRDLAYNCAKGTRSVENCLTDFTLSSGKLIGFSSKVAGFQAAGVSPGQSADAAAKRLHQPQQTLCGGAGPGFLLSGHGFRILIWVSGSHHAGGTRYKGGHVESIELDDIAHALAC
ncbi:MAG: hypothetical protein J2O48_01015 [Solirubrobacterales bacterium]|nr:hypothetical protein [Solirubrobacterales bacterium]